MFSMPSHIWLQNKLSFIPCEMRAKGSLALPPCFFNVPWNGPPTSLAAESDLLLEIIGGKDNDALP